VYICDLGSDTVWIGERHENGMEVVGKMESEKGDTPRHCLLSADGMSCLISVQGVPTDE
jgi:6-phosphogluconolactonase (cycloisomerase 2 family)